MEHPLLPTEIILIQPRRSLGDLRLDWTPQPGNYLDWADQTYLILERHHRYQLKAGRYHLHKIFLYVQPAQRPQERSLEHGRWVLGDATCHYNAHSELLRCAVNPDGPCAGCRHYESWHRYS
jgi:hypothetical protein